MAQRYVVKSKDNPLTLAKKFETSPQELLKNNGLRSLTPGQTIRVPLASGGNLGGSGATGGSGSFISGAGTVNMGQGSGPISNKTDKPVKTLIGGQTVTVMPNSVISTNVAPQPTFFQNLWNGLTGQGQQQGGNLSGVRGNVVPNNKINGLASPAQSLGYSAPMAQGSFVSGSGGVNLAQPQMNGPFVVNRNPIFNGVHTQAPVFGQTTQAQGSFVSGGGQVNIPPAYTGGMLSPDKNAVAAPPRYVSGSFISGGGQVNTYGQGYAQANTNNVQQAPQTPQRPQGVFTGDPNDPNTAAWRNYWNYSAQHPETVPQAAPVVMTRDQVWNMKAAQRRRENGGGGDGGTVEYQPYVMPVYEPFYGSNVTQGVWRP